MLDAVADGRVDVLLVSPERLGNPRFAAQLPGADRPLRAARHRRGPLHLGLGFRLPARLPAPHPHADVARRGTPVLATTATANARVTSDVAAQLGPHTVTLRGSLARASLRLAVVPGLDPVARYAWVADALDAARGSGIVYVLTVAETERARRAPACTRSRRRRLLVGGRPRTSANALEARLRANEVKAVVATSALGMGYDKPDLAFCIHVGSPSSPVAYYQQVGRAGRALDDADRRAAAGGRDDERIWEYFATVRHPRAGARRRRARRPRRWGRRSLPALETATGLRRGRLEAMLQVLAVDGVVERTTGTAGCPPASPWVYDAAKWTRWPCACRPRPTSCARYAAGPAA